MSKYHWRLDANAEEIKRKTLEENFKKEKDKIMDEAPGRDNGEKASGVKYDTGKPRIDLISTIATLKKARVYSHGAEIYGPHNWRKGIQWSRVLAALLRHTFAYLGGQDLDPETGLSHMAHAACCIDFLLEYEETHRHLDDRFKRPMHQTCEDKECLICSRGR